MKRLLLFTIVVVMNMGLLAQNENHYWYKDRQKVFLEKNPNKKYVVLDNIKSQDELREKLNLPDLRVYKFGYSSVNSSINSYDGKAKSEVRWAVIEGERIADQILDNNRDILYEAPFFYTSKGEEAGLSHLFYVKLHKQDDLSKLKALAEQNNVEILGNNKYMPLWYTLSCSKKSEGNTLEMAGLFYESELFAASEPNFMVENLLSCTNDNLFGDQWGLQNTGQNGGTIGADINACQAWQVTTGSNNITVAVLDHGVELNHPDMPNMFPLSYNTETATSPSQILGSHGTACAGISGAASDNSVGVAGVAPDAPLMSISNSLTLAVGTEQRLADGLNWAWQHGASVISNSWGSDAFSTTMINDAINNALTQGRNGLGTVVVFATHNYNSTVVFPASSTAYSNEDLLAVGAISPCEERKSPTSCDGEGWGSNYGPELDIMAPGVLIPTTDRQGSNGYVAGDYNATFNGTSSATPHVAAVAALILSVNHNLTQQEVGDIIESTAQKMGSYNYQTTAGRPNGTWHNEMGYGVVDAEAAVLAAQSQCTSPQLDLFSKDWYDDFGEEPNTDTDLIYLSTDIWVRNQPDGQTEHEHENPIVDPGQPYVYVRVRNRGCQPTNGTEELKLYWAKAGTALSWPNSWDGSTTMSGLLMGDEIGTLTISNIIPPGGEIILQFQWTNPPDPSDYDVIFPNDPWHFCFLSRIVTPADPLTETSNLANNVINNNNIVWKNVTVVDSDPTGFAPGGVVSVGNFGEEEDNFYLEFTTDPGQTTLQDISEIYVTMNEDLFNKWKEHQSGRNVKLISEDERKIQITDLPARIGNLYFEPEQWGAMKLGFNVLAEGYAGESDLPLYVSQRHENGSLKGGEAYILRPDQDVERFRASAGEDQSISRGDIAYLRAADIGRSARYEWYAEGNLIGTGKTISVAPMETQDYKLRVVAKGDGFVDYDNTKVRVGLAEIYSLVPNPANNEVTVNYDVKNAKRAELRIQMPYAPIYNSYSLDVNKVSKTINISDYKPGIYIITLVCDGNVMSSKQLSIE